MSKSPSGGTNSPRRKIFILSAVGLLAIGGATGASAFTPNVAGEVGHFVECFGWMITDPSTHEGNCLPGQVPPLDSLIEYEDGDQPVVVTPPPLPPPPPTFT